MNDSELIDKVQAMRTAQRDFYASRRKGRPEEINAKLKAALALEKEVDVALAERSDKQDRLF